MTPIEAWCYMVEDMAKAYHDKRQELGLDFLQAEWSDWPKPHRDMLREIMAHAARIGSYHTDAWWGSEEG